MVANQKVRIVVGVPSPDNKTLAITQRKHKMGFGRESCLIGKHPHFLLDCLELVHFRGGFGRPKLLEGGNSDSLLGETLKSWEL